MAKSIQAVIFDFGNVLALVDRPKICACFSAHSPYSADQIEQRIFGTDIEYDSETGKYDSQEHFRRIKERIEANHGWTYQEFQQEFEQGLTVDPYGVECLELAAISKRVFILSNISYLHALFLFKQEKIATLPELHIFSFKIGIMKPDPGIWQAALRVGAVSPEDCLYIDDIKEYCEVSRSLGFNTIHYRVGVTDLKAELTHWL